ncbi:hypothetical protein CHELA40_50152 [Chelatococcus asaccharovorans]|nr:hypothetical protein CHELA17_20115 [Chelatococcus asaccharovorans]CAH1691452.1 hypothetical protein CHELA40_50152 [Chelatococcus asaccharovorans]
MLMHSPRKRVANEDLLRHYSSRPFTSFARDRRLIAESMADLRIEIRFVQQQEGDIYVKA